MLHKLHCGSIITYKHSHLEEMAKLRLHMQDKQKKVDNVLPAYTIGGGGGGGYGPTNFFPQNELV